MARKRSKVLSTIRALGDKPEPTLTRHKQEDKGAGQPPLQTPLIPVAEISIAEESELGLQEPETPSEQPSNDLVASLLLTSVLEEQLSESATETAAAIHISEVSPSEASSSEASPSEVRLFEANPSEANPSEADPSEASSSEASLSEITTPKVTESWPGEPELKESAIAEPAPEPEAAPPQPEAQSPKSELELVNAAELLKRPEALVLIVVTCFWTIWQTYTNLWQRTPRKKN